MKKSVEPKIIEEDVDMEPHKGITLKLILFRRSKERRV
jgi:hypothetical protein